MKKSKTITLNAGKHVACELAFGYKADVLFTVRCLYLCLSVVVFVFAHLGQQVCYSRFEKYAAFCLQFAVDVHFRSLLLRFNTFVLQLVSLVAPFARALLALRTLNKWSFFLDYPRPYFSNLE